MLARNLVTRYLPKSVIAVTAVPSRLIATSAKDAQPLVLLPYQESCLNVCLQALADRPRNIGVSLPTGSGKTAVFLSLLAKQRPPDARPEARQALILVNSVETLEQAEAHARRQFPELTIEVEQRKQVATGLADM